jgi:twitching motility protein PilT
MWSKRRRSAPPEARALLQKIRAKGWKNETERDDVLRKLAAVAGLEPEDVAWMAAESDAALRQASVATLQKFPFEAASAAMFPYLAAHGDVARRNISAAVELVGSPDFASHVPTLLGHSDPGVVAIALDWLKRNPSEPWLDAIALALGSTSPLVRRKAFGAIESVLSKKSFQIALEALGHDDEEIRYRAVLHVAKFPDETSIAPLLRRCHNDSPRVLEAAIAAVAPLLSGGGAGGPDPRFNEYILPLLTDSNARVRQLAIRLLSTQPPVHVADAFLKGFCNHFGPGRDRAIEGLKSLGNDYIRAFLDRDDDPVMAISALASSIAVHLKTPEVVPHCIRYLSGPDWWLRDRAALMLAELKDERALAPLLEMLKDPESDLSAAAALGGFGSAQALPGLLDAFKRGMIDLRLEILDAFAKIRDPRVPPLLDQIARMVQEPLVQEKAQRIMAALSGEVPFYEAEGERRIFDEIDFRENPTPTLNQLLAHARALGASDLHLAVGTRPHVRLIGRLQPLPLPETTDEQMKEWVPALLGDRMAELEEARQADFCFKERDLGRFRTNVFYQRKGLNAVFRLVPFEIPTLTDIQLPESLWELTTYNQGLVLVTGPSGCGKTTTLAAIVDRINETERSHILTIEDPIEYVHANKESLVNQREIPAHSKSFARALRQSLREDPDVILVGEMRDLETISLAITASETGHLVLGTLHTTTASSTIDRIINAFPPDQQGQIRMMIADSLKAVVSQTLLPRRDQSGLIAAYEILRNTPNVSGLIREGKTFQS